MGPIVIALAIKEAGRAKIAVHCLRASADEPPSSSTWSSRLDDGNLDRTPVAW